MFFLSIYVKLFKIYDEIIDQFEKGIKNYIGIFMMNKLKTRLSTIFAKK